MKRLFFVCLAVLWMGSFSAQTTKTSSNKTKTLIYGPISASKVKTLFFTKTGFQLPPKIASINTIARYTSYESSGSGNIYTWDFSNSFQISSITDALTEGKPDNNEEIILVNFNYGSVNYLELGNSIILNKSTVSSIQKLYPNQLVKFKKADLPTYKIKSGAVYATFFFNEKNILTSFSIANYDLELY